ncbi:hypothetical protein SAY87_019608 [Trapa incisa]|uniref:Uncharacterized protein n=1 Tax=Trapa incisa TaxID=236973 RepID=A0AAN7K2N4_9MYRT|nr:hypothetical protein SAY87_019608 [Trapa incisa]
MVTMLKRPISSHPPSSTAAAATASAPQYNHRKRGSGSSSEGASSLTTYQVTPLKIVDPSSRFSCQGSAPTTTAASSPQQLLVLSGGKDDLGALAMLEDSVKKLKSPKTSPCPTLSKAQIDCALDCLADWVYESCGSVSLSSLEHPKFKNFLGQLGLPFVARREFAGARLDVKFQGARADSEARIRDALFFQYKPGFYLESESYIELMKYQHNHTGNDTTPHPVMTLVGVRSIYSTSLQTDRAEWADGKAHTNVGAHTP